MRKKIHLTDKLKAYRLINKVVVVTFLIVVVIVSVVLYAQPWAQENEIVQNILMAVFTSIMVSILVMTTEVYVAYKDNERDKFLEDIYTFGIANLNVNKEAVLKELLQTCDSLIWISGYRLIMTNNLRNDFAAAVERGACGVAILCAPWTKAFELVYGKNEKVMSNYFEVFHCISVALKKVDANFNVLISEKPIFSDTYRIDKNLITGPYMHNTDPEYNRIMAKDFFSYNLTKRSRLYELVVNEFETLADEAVMVLNWERFDEAYESRQKGDYNEKEQVELFKNACDFLITEERFALK